MKSEVYPKLSQDGALVKIVNNKKLLTIPAKRSILDVSQISEYDFGSGWRCSIPQRLATFQNTVLDKVTISFQVLTKYHFAGWTRCEYVYVRKCLRN